MLERRATAGVAQPHLQAQLAEEALGEHYFALFRSLDIETWVWPGGRKNSRRRSTGCSPSTRCSCSSWASSLSPVRATVVLASTADAAGSSDAAVRLLTGTVPFHRASSSRSESAGTAR